MKVITVKKIDLFVIRCRSINGTEDFFSNIIKRISEIDDITRRNKNILILTGELKIETSFSPISKYDKVKRKKVMVEARAKAPFISILSFFWGEESFLILSFFLIIFLSILILLSSLLSLLELWVDDSNFESVDCFSSFISSSFFFYIFFFFDS